MKPCGVGSGGFGGRLGGREVVGGSGIFVTGGSGTEVSPGGRGKVTVVSGRFISSGRVVLSIEVIIFVHAVNNNNSTIKRAIVFFMKVPLVDIIPLSISYFQQKFKKLFFCYLTNAVICDTMNSIESSSFRKSYQRFGVAAESTDYESSRKSNTRIVKR